MIYSAFKIICRVLVHIFSVINSGGTTSDKSDNGANACNVISIHTSPNQGAQEEQSDPQKHSPEWKQEEATEKKEPTEAPEEKGSEEAPEKKEPKEEAPVKKEPKEETQEKKEPMKVTLNPILNTKLVKEEVNLKHDSSTKKKPVREEPRARDPDQPKSGSLSKPHHHHHDHHHKKKDEDVKEAKRHIQLKVEPTRLPQQNDSKFVPPRKGHKDSEKHRTNQPANESGIKAERSRDSGTGTNRPGTKHPLSHRPKQGGIIQPKNSNKNPKPKHKTAEPKGTGAKPIQPSESETSLTTEGEQTTAETEAQGGLKIQPSDSETSIISEENPDKGLVQEQGGHTIQPSSTESSVVSYEEIPKIKKQSPKKNKTKKSSAGVHSEGRSKVGKGDDSNASSKSSIVSNSSIASYITGFKNHDHHPGCPCRLPYVLFGFLLGFGFCRIFFRH